MKVVLLAGGLGTRMREETEYKPKPMVSEVRRWKKYMNSTLTVPWPETFQKMEVKS